MTLLSNQLLKASIDRYTILIQFLEKEIQMNGFPIEKEDENIVKIKLCRSLLIFILDENIDLNKYCPYCVKKDYVAGFKSKLIHFTSQNNEKFNDELLLAHIYILREFTIIGMRYGIEQEILNYWDKFLHFNIKENYHRQLDYIKNRFAIDVINFDILTKFNEKDFQAFLNYENNKQECEQLNQEYQQNLSHKQNKMQQYLDNQEQKVERLHDILKKMESNFNFLALSKGFSHLLKKKERSKIITYIILFLLSIGMIGLPIFNFVQLSNEKWKEIIWQQMLTGIGLEFILIYFFRVVLNQCRSIETQIMQLELRLSLCQFIESYADYAQKIKEKDGHSLEKFENLIFSSILSSDDKIPSTFDGMEQLTNLIKELKSK